MGRHGRSKNAMSGGHFAGQGPDPYSRASAGDYHDRLAKKRRRGFALRTLLIALVVLLAGSGVAVAAWVGNIQSRMNNSEVVTTELREALTERDAPNDPYYVLLLGTDGRPGETQYRSDTIILARVDPPAQKVTLVSIPRDTLVDMGEHRAEDQRRLLVRRRRVHDRGGLQVCRRKDLPLRGAGL